jgi:phage baseplate assembly protein W
MELDAHSDGDLKKDVDIDAVINSLNNIVSTVQGSRRMLPEFAQYLWELLFEPMDATTARELGQGILEAVRTWDDRIVVEGIDIMPDYDNNEYRCVMTFRIKPIEQQESVEFILFTQ